MSKLQKSAWFNLGMCTVCISISALCVYFLASRNAKGVDYLLVCFIVACLTAPITYIAYKKKGIESGFDERERMIYRRAFSIAVIGLIVFLACVCVVPFFALGGQSLIKVYYLPLIFFSSLFAAQFVHSTAILIQCALEEEDGQ